MKVWVVPDEQRELIDLWRKRVQRFKREGYALVEKLTAEYHKAQREIAQASRVATAAVALAERLLEKISET